MPPKTTPALPIQIGDRVTVPDCPLTGRVNMIWKTATSRWCRVQFPPHSPFVDDWSVWRDHELSPTPPETKAKSEKYPENYPTNQNAT